MAYDDTTGVMTYTGPSASETHAHFSAGGDLTYSNGVYSYTSQWASASGNIKTTNSLTTPGHNTETFDMGGEALANSPEQTLDAGSITSAADRTIDLGILDQGRLF